MRIKEVQFSLNLACSEVVILLVVAECAYCFFRHGYVSAAETCSCLISNTTFD